MAIGRPTKPLKVTPEEEEKLTMMAGRPKTGQALAMRARIVLGCSGAWRLSQFESWARQLSPLTPDRRPIRTLTEWWKVADDLTGTGTLSGNRTHLEC